MRDGGRNVKGGFSPNEDKKTDKRIERSRVRKSAQVHGCGLVRMFMYDGRGGGGVSAARSVPALAQKGYRSGRRTVLLV